MRLTSTNTHARKILFAAIPFICALSSKNISNLLIKFQCYWIIYQKVVFQRWSSLPILGALPKGEQSLLLIILSILFVLIFIKLGFSLGYLWMDELSRAVSQFLPPSDDGGILGVQPPVPSGESSIVPMENEDQSGPSASQRDKAARLAAAKREEETRLAELQTDPILKGNVAYRNALKKQERIIYIMREILTEHGIEIADPVDVRRGVDMFLSDIMDKDPSTRRKELVKIFDSLSASRGASPYFEPISEEIEDFQ